MRVITLGALSCALALAFGLSYAHAEEVREGGSDDPSFTPPVVEEWALADHFISPISKATYDVYKNIVAGTQRLDGPAGSFADWQSVVRAEIDASGIPANLFKAEDSLRAAYLAGESAEQQMILVLTEQPVVERSGAIWLQHEADLNAVEEAARSNSDSSRAPVLAQLVETKREAIRAEIMAAAMPEVQASQARTIAELEQAGVHGATPLAITLNSLLVKAPVSKLADIAAIADIAVVDPDRLVDAQLAISVPTTGQGTYTANGYFGGALDIAVGDSGIDFSHPALSPRSFSGSRTYFPAGTGHACYGDNTASTDDLTNHGTHVGGIVGSLGSAGWATYKGMMTGGSTGLINVKSGWKNNCTGGASMFWSDGINNFDWAINTWTYRADGLNLSYGGGNDNGTSAMALFLDAAAYALGIPTAVSNGNSGPGLNTVGDPATAYNVLATGSSFDNNTTGRGDDVISGFSSRGNTTDGRLKPDVVAPGEGIFSTAWNWEGGFFGSNPDFISFNGTSMAAPHVAGAYALAGSAGLGGALRWKAQVMNSANLAELGGGGVLNSNTGHGYMDLTRHYNEYKAATGRYASGTLTTTAPFRFLRLSAPISSDKLTLHWQRHVTYNGPNPPVTYSPSGDVDLEVYSENTNAFLAGSTQIVNNYEYLTGASFGSASDNVIVVDAFSGVLPEPWGLAGTFTLTGLNPPAFAAPTLSLPTRFPNGGTGTVSATITNTGGVRAHNVSATLTLPAGYTTSSPNPAPAVSIAAGGSAVRSWTVQAPASPCNAAVTFSVAGSSASYGESFTIPSGSGTSRTNCIPSVTVTSPNGGEFWNGTKSITWTASDAEADVLSYTAQWTTNGITYTNICATGLLTCSWNTASVADGVAYKIRVLAADAYNVGNDSSNANFTVDNTIPSLTYSLSGTLGGGGWYRSSVTVTLACSDATAGVNSIRYAVNGGASTPYSSPFTISAQGVNTFTATCDDRATNVANIGPITVKIDTVAPTITHSEAGTAGGGGWYRSPVTVTLSCTDASSGVGSISYTINGGPSNAYSAPFVVSAQGDNSIVGTCLDVATNSGTTGTFHVMVDTVAPSITHSESGTAGGGGWWRSSVTVTLTCTDATSGVGSITYTLNGGAPVTYSGPFSVTAQGANTVNATCADVAGNSASTGSYAINIDTVAPTLTYSLAGTLGSGGWYRSNVAVTLTCTDATSGVGSRSYVLDGGPSTPYGAPFTITGDGTHSFTGACNDVAGNSSSTGAQTVRIDTVIPSLSHSLSGTLGGGGWYRSAVQVTLTCADATSGPGVTTFTVDGGSSTTYTAPFSITTDGNHTVVANCSDVAGNASATDTFPVKIDQTGPSVNLASPAFAVASFGVSWTASDPLSGLTGSIQIQEQATILGSGFGTVCTDPVSGASQSGSCARAPLLPNIYCYRGIVSDIAGNTTTTGGTTCTIFV